MSNFIFLKKINNDLYKIISEAEQLFRDEYYEQVMVQVRRFAENLCKDLLGDKVNPDDTFDNMINKIKDNSFENNRLKEVVEDLYFIKKNGNQSAHSASSDKNGENALECMERAFEISIFYSHMKAGFDETLDKTMFSEELLVTGKQSKKINISEKYAEELEKEREEEKEKIIKTLKTSEPKKKNKSSKKKKEEISYQYEPEENSKTIPAVRIIFFALLFCTIVLITLSILKRMNFY